MLNFQVLDFYFLLPAMWDWWQQEFLVDAGIEVHEDYAGCEDERFEGKMVVYPWDCTLNNHPNKR